jgi:thiol-disulfide isomerase/thioredoxin
MPVYPLYLPELHLRGRRAGRLPLRCELRLCQALSLQSLHVPREEVTLRHAPASRLPRQAGRRPSAYGLRVDLELPARADTIEGPVSGSPIQRLPEGHAAHCQESEALVVFQLQQRRRTQRKRRVGNERQSSPPERQVRFTVDVVASASHLVEPILAKELRRVDPFAVRRRRDGERDDMGDRAPVGQIARIAEARTPAPGRPAGACYHRPAAMREGLHVSKTEFSFVVGLSALVALSGCASQPVHGTITSSSIASRHDWKACPHRVPEEVCVRCKPERAASFKQKGDWCQEHDVPESQCLACHPDLDFSPASAPPQGADVVQLVSDGRDLPALEPHRVPNKVTVFDFHAAWCPPCRKVDEHLYPKLAKRPDIAVRKIDVGSWDTPVARRWLGEVAELPYLVIFDKKGRKVAAIAGAQLQEIDRALAEASR